MSNWAKPGVKCVCVNAYNFRRTPSLGLAASLVKGAVYTITSVSADGQIFLAETRTATGVPFYADRFRPLITRTQEQDVALFKSLLNKVVAPVHA